MRKSDSSLPPVVAVLNNIRPLYNVGSIFRTSDALGVEKLYLGGITGTPENPRLAKTALAGLESVGWEYKKSALRTVRWLKSQGYYVVCLELGERSVPLQPASNRPLAIVIGHERTGVDRRILDEADAIMAIPMGGKGKSLNVAVAYGIAAYTLLSRKTNA
jgi:tRNA G18 (ribose-2'-O)-methylase SpoU